MSETVGPREPSADGGPPEFERLWLALSEARYRSVGLGDPAEQLAVPPWESSDPRVLNLWERITDPGNLRDLEERAGQNLNPVAAEYTRQALNECRRRAALRARHRPRPWWVAVTIGRHPKRTLIRIAVLVLGSFILFKYVLIPIRVTGISMAPTYPDGSIHFVNRLSFTWSKPHRGDVVAVLMTGKKFMYLKRVIGLPRETLVIQRGIVHIDGRPLEEPYLPVRAPWQLEAVQLRENEYFVIGDNRTMPQDEHEFGTVEELRIVGRAVF
jgi:signal peptidase I